MREILFRGKRKDNGEWVEGYYVCVGGKFHYILTGQIDLMSGYPRFFYCEVIPETVGQYTGLADKNGKKIFEGNIVKHINVFEEINSPEIGVVVYEQSECCFEIQRTYKNPENVHIPTSTRVTYIIPDKRNLYEIIGNIHDNPELLKGE